MHLRSLILTLAKTEALNTEITRQFELGTDTLFPADHHFLEGKQPDDIISKNATEKQLWVECILEARRLCIDNRDNEQERMRSLMRNFLSGNT